MRSATTAGSEGGSASWWATTDPLRIARVQLGGVLAALLLGVQLALVLRAGLLGQETGLVGAGALGSSLTAHGLVMVFLFALPALPLVVGGAVLAPLVGARGLVFPALHRATLRLYLGAWALLALALISGPVDAAWRLLSPLDGSPLWTAAAAAAGLHLLGLALVCNALNTLATCHWERSEAVGIRELPVLAWGLAAGAAVQLVVAVALASLGLLLFVGHAGSSALAGDPLAFQRLFDFVLHAGATVVLLPAIGVAFEVVATFSRKAPAGGVSNAVALAALALLSLGGSGVALVGDGVPVPILAAHSGLSLLALVPATVLLFNLLATLAGGAIEISTALLHALILVVLLTIGGAAGLFLATLSTGAYLQGSLFDTAQLHFLLGGGALSGLTTALYYWWPYLMGRRTREGLGRLGAALLFTGYLLAFLPHFVAGSRGVSAFGLLSTPGRGATEMASGAGAVVLLLGLCVVGWDFLTSLLAGPRAVANPWGATTGEWRSPSPSAEGEVSALAGSYDFAALHRDEQRRSAVAASGAE